MVMSVLCVLISVQNYQSRENIKSPGLQLITLTTNGHPHRPIRRRPQQPWRAAPEVVATRRRDRSVPNRGGFQRTNHNIFAPRTAAACWRRWRCSVLARSHPHASGTLPPAQRAASGAVWRLLSAAAAAAKTWRQLHKAGAQVRRARGDADAARVQRRLLGSEARLPADLAALQRGRQRAGNPL